MATGEIVKPREIVKANNELFRCKYTIKDVVAGRIFMAFASLVDHRDVKENDSFVEYSIDADSILSDTCMGGDNYRQLREAAHSLIDQKIELHISKKEFYFYTLFSKIGYKDGVIIGQFHKDLMPFFLIAKERFTKMHLSEYMRLPSIYSQCIFSFLKSWSDKKEITVKLSELHEMVDAPQSLRKDFFNFKARVLDKAHNDINEKTSLNFDYETIKDGRAVSEIRFIFHNKKEKPLAEDIKADTLLKSAPEGTIPDPQSANRRFEEFLARFPNSNQSRVGAGRLWHELDRQANAPLAKDVDDARDPVEFLKQWQARAKEAETRTRK